jgi:murein DD-endopeptidase MepM/ murein hydrolase activator NlpD
MTRTKNNYSLPLKLEDIICCSKKSSPAHTGKLQHSIDFVCEEGTRIYAAFGGIVVYIKKDSNIGGPHKRFWNDGNRIVIKHKNEEYTAYEHLRYHGSNVKVGEKVKKGKLIGYSRNTGYSYCPHLHFEVFTQADSELCEGMTLQVFISDLINRT